MVNISPVALDVLENLEDKLQETIINRNNRINLEEGILTYLLSGLMFYNFRKKSG